MSQKVAHVLPSTLPCRVKGEAEEEGGGSDNWQLAPCAQTVRGRGRTLYSYSRADSPPLALGGAIKTPAVVA